LQKLFYENSFNPQETPENVTPEIVHNLQEIRRVLVDYHDSLFVEVIDDLLLKVRTFGSHFATLDIRQDSSVLRDTYRHLLDRHADVLGSPAGYTGQARADPFARA
jgi:phosphoenolpyruvate carboxylase